MELHFLNCRIGRSGSGLDKPTQSSNAFQHSKAPSPTVSNPIMLNALADNRDEHCTFPHPSRPDPDFDLLAKATAEISSLSPERLCNFQRWRRHVQSFGDCNRDQERNSTSKLSTETACIEELPEVHVELMYWSDRNLKLH